VEVVGQRGLITACTVLLGAFTAAFAAPVAASPLFDHQVVIIGETHRHTTILEETEMTENVGASQLILVSVQ
jgi:Spy/CpxP family protein refolding chaperone